MANLPTNYLDDILAESMNGKRKFRITHSNGLFEDVTIEDVSEYDQIGSNFGAGDINKTNQAVNEKFDSGDVVDPMIATEKGFAADAKFTRDAIDGINSNMVTGYSNPTEIALVSDSSAYTDEHGYYVLADSITGVELLADTQTYTTITVEGNFYRMAGADTVSPFKGKSSMDIILHNNTSSSTESISVTLEKDYSFVVCYQSQTSPTNYKSMYTIIPTREEVLEDGMDYNNNIHAGMTIYKDCKKGDVITSKSGQYFRSIILGI